ncbi:uncharacterized protein Z518_01605 [Rhinocladiella mackenziei CBS 650.93]|uniref:Rhinocladiella mackenziei CBS 650.93 unplaced genomic scaffold supercont1.1, whole genome shotgun sequence n=1 Tax=Rhinocladiella mackenziei CBS 650.93 TaxID=1442369 RepID=A0A0D2G6E7_9EURO|nr:uncharacterized protein Z518_01605 [Rhinocladiella mackenziei CBS 650.93]KIX10522.1 hypothetical protein Z518_01605 [Rhinocladiella mackenziei CBS 650.93]
MLGMVPPSERDTMIGRMEIYTESSALATVQASSEYKEYFDLVERESLYATNEDLAAWYPTAGFVARKGEKETPRAGIVMLAKFVCKDGEDMREKLVDVLGKFCDWVEANEAGTLTYCVMTRPKAPNEVLLFERYLNLQALGVHGKTKEFKAMFKGTGPFIQGRKTVLSEWVEQDGSFVSNTPGGAGVQTKL